MEPAGGAAASSTVTTPRVAEVQVEKVGEEEVEVEELVVEKVEVVVEDKGGGCWEQNHHQWFFITERTSTAQSLGELVVLLVP